MIMMSQNIKDLLYLKIQRCAKLLQYKFIMSFLQHNIYEQVILINKESLIKEIIITLLKFSAVLLREALNDLL